jgi:hypothetical protein
MIGLTLNYISAELLHNTNKIERGDLIWAMIFMDITEKQITITE